MKKDHITDDLIHDIVNSISENKPLRKKLPGGGRLHIDRQLPFLCVYRKPHPSGGDDADKDSDKGTEQLLLGEAAYLLIGDHPNQQERLHQFVFEIAKALEQAFGHICLLELWAEDFNAESDDNISQPAFKIFAPQERTPQRFLNELENALLHIEVDGKKSEVEVTYQKQITPPCLDPLLNVEQLQALNCIHVGLAVNPIYRDHETKELLPFHLKELQHGLARALKRGFFTFAREHTRYRPRHYHQLGRRAMTKAVWDTDQQLAEISDTFDLLLYVSPVNSAEAWETFKENRYEKPPAFLYRSRNINPSLVKRALFQIPVDRIEDPTLAHIFSEKRNELDRQITLVADRNTRRFLLGSRQLYGDPESELLELAKSILKTVSRENPASDMEYLMPEEIAHRAHMEFEYYRQQDPSLPATVEIRDDIPGILVSHGKLLVGKDARIHVSRINGVINHEVGTHILTHHNGNQQPFRELYVGMAGYESLQEGLAVLAEYLCGELLASRLRLLAGRVLAVDMITTGADFVECFKNLQQDLGFAHRTAFEISMRVYRGGGYTKDLVYLRGLSQLLRYLKEGHALEPLYLGKISHDYLDFIEELQWREILKKPCLRPRYLNTEAIHDRLKDLRKGLSVLDLIAC